MADCSADCSAYVVCVCERERNRKGLKWNVVLRCHPARPGSASDWLCEDWHIEY